MRSHEPRLRPRLAYLESRIPAPSPERRARLAAGKGFALEVEHRPGTDTAARFAGLPVLVLQAYGLHRFHPLAEDPADVERARAHVLETLDQAARLGAPWVVTVAAYGACRTAGALRRAGAFFASLGPEARRRGVKILIEPLSPRRTSAFTRPGEVARLLERLADPEAFGLVLDTGHLLDGGDRPERWFAQGSVPLEAVQFRGPEGAPPDPGWPYGDWLGRLPRPPALVSVEHRAPIEREAWERLTSALAAAVGGGGRPAGPG